MAGAVAGSARLPALDAARAFAMLLVIGAHALMAFMQTPIGWAIQDQSRHLAADLVVWICHGFLMPTFFLIAGFFAHHTVEKTGIAGFARQRLQRVLVPLVVTVVPISVAMNALWDWGKALTRGARAAPPAEISRLRASELPVTLSHLWYLYYLLIVSAGVVALVLVWRRAPQSWQQRAHTWSRRVVGSVALPLLLAIPSAIFLGVAGKLQLDTPLTFVVDPWIAGFHGLFFLLGWIFHVHTGLLASQARHGAVYGALALVCLLLLIPVLSRRADTLARPSALALYQSAVFSCATMLAFLALCFRLMTRPQRWIRFVADASYFCYITHLPLVVLLQIVAWKLRWPGPIELAGILACTLSACLLTYRYLIRDTFLRAYLG